MVKYVKDQDDKLYNKINFNLFQKILLDFQLKGHERFLEPFRHKFNDVDTDSNGIIDETEFRTLVSSVGASKSDKETDDLLHKIDANNNEQITFSECVVLFSSIYEDVTNGINTQSVSLLQRLAVEDVTNNTLNETSLQKIM